MHHVTNGVLTTVGQQPCGGAGWGVCSTNMIILPTRRGNALVSMAEGECTPWTWLKGQCTWSAWLPAATAP